MWQAIGIKSSVIRIRPAVDGLLRQVCGQRSLHFDMVIVGSSMVGSAMACSVGSSELLKSKSVLLLDSATPQRSVTPLPAEFSNRVCAITPSSVQLFQNVGVWATLCSQRVKPVHRMQVWEDSSKSHIAFQNPKGDLSPMAYIVENPLMVSAFLQNVQTMQNVTVRTGTKVKSYRLPADMSAKAEVVLEDGSVITTDLLVGADGANSLVRKSMNVRTIGWKYDQKSIVANLTLKPVDNPSNDIAWQKFLPTGSLALLPLSETMSSLSWACDTPFADHLMALPDKDFIDTINDTLYNSTHESRIVNGAVDLLNSLQSVIFGKHPLHAHPPVITDIKHRFAIPLSLVHVTHYVVPRAALIGDAAHRIHPLAGQGVNAGYGDVACLIETLESAVQCGSDIGSLSHLKQYETRRQRKVVPMMFACDWLNRLYGTTCFPVVLVRSLGLSSINNITPIKKLLVMEATGEKFAYF